MTSQSQKPSKEDIVKAAVHRTFDLRPMPSGIITISETMDRIELANEIFRDLATSGKSIYFIQDHLVKIMVDVIDGAQSELPQGSMWAPDVIESRLQPERRLSALAVKDVDKDR